MRHQPIKMTINSFGAIFINWFGYSGFWFLANHGVAFSTKLKSFIRFCDLIVNNGADIRRYSISRATYDFWNFAF